MTADGVAGDLITVYPSKRHGTEVLLSNKRGYIFPCLSTGLFIILDNISISGLRTRGRRVLGMFSSVFTISLLVAAWMVCIEQRGFSIDASTNLTGPGRTDIAYYTYYNPAWCIYA
jgi:hypothetical protein